MLARASSEYLPRTFLSISPALAIPSHPAPSVVWLIVSHRPAIYSCNPYFWTFRFEYYKIIPHVLFPTEPENICPGCTISILQMLNRR
jgi:hypothetical protein